MNLFAYGSLLVPEIWHLVTERGSPSTEAFLPGYEIRRVRDGDFPGIRKAAGGGGVPGRVFFDLDPEVVRRLDAYEADFYERVAVSPVGTGNRLLEAQAYVVPEHHSELLSEEEWTLDWFREHALAGYYARLKGLA